MADLQVKTANICNITSSTTLWSNAGGSGTYIADNSISVHMTNHRASGIYISSLHEQGVIGDKYTISFVPVCATNNVMFVVLYGTTTQISFTSGNRYTLTITATAADTIMGFYGADSVEKTIIIKDIQIEKGETATVYRPYSATGWLHSLRKLTTATDTFTTLPTDIYADGNNATVGISGNTVQNGTPTPTNPVDVNGVGVRTENLFDYETMKDGKTGYYLDASGNEIENTDFWSITQYIPVDDTVFTLARTFGGNAPAICLYDSNKNFITGVSYQGERVVTISSNTNAAYIRFSYFIGEPLEDIAHDMLNTGSTALPYEPYGIKIPISSASTTTPVYLGEVESTRRIKKLVLTGAEVFAKNDPSNPLNYMYYQTGYLANEYCFCTHLVNMGTLSTSKVGVFNSNNVLYLNFGSAIMNVQPSGNTVAGLKEYLAAQYAAGTPVTIWYVLATETTGIVNEPLCKIGDYADEVSNVSIPVTAGGDTLSVDTTVQPSEVTVSYTGWHDATVKEWDGSQWNE